MLRTPIIGAVSGAALTLSAAAFAQQGGTAEDARAMLDKAVAAVKTDQAVALAMFLKGEGGFLDRDLYPFCFRIADGKTLASPKAVPVGTDVRSLKDATGNAYGVAIYAAGQKPGRSSHRAAELHVSKARHHRADVSEGELCYQGRRARLRRRILQVDCSRAVRRVGKGALRRAHHLSELLCVYDRNNAK
jgi:hypothetical protein